MKNIEILKPTGLFTNYIYKAIPLAFDESMSYYETLAGLLSYLKDTVIPAVNNNGDAVAELQNLYNELHEYVEKYFDNLDVQNEINNKLDKMTEDGTLTSLIENYINPYIELQNNRILQIENTISTIGSASPAGVYESIEALTTADPDHNKIYVVSANGHWYYYNNGWQDGGVYQSTGIMDNSIDYIKLNKNLFNKNLFVTSQGKDSSNCLGLSVLCDVSNLDVKDTYLVNAYCDLDIKFNYNYQCNFRTRFIGNNIAQGDIVNNNPVISNEFNVTRNTNNYTPVMLTYIYLTSNNAPSDAELIYYVKNLSINLDGTPLKILDIKMFNTQGTIIDTKMSNNNNFKDVLHENINVYNDNEINNAIKYENTLYNSSGLWQNDNRFDTLIIPILPNTKYYFRQSSQNYSQTYTGALGIVTNTNSISLVDMGNIPTTNGGKILDINGVYLIKSFKKPEFINNDYETGLIVKEYKNYSNQHINNIKNIDIIPYFEKSILNNKTILVIGDSISDNTLTQYSNIYYYDLLKLNDGCNLLIDGKGGTGYTMGSGSYLNFTNRMDNYPQNYKPNYIIYFGGTNDWFNAETNQIPLGTIDDVAGSRSFVGYVKYTLEKTIRLYTSSKILVLTPIRRNRGVNYNGKIVNSTTDGYRNTLDEYCEMLIKIANSYGIATVDLYNQCGLNPKNTYNKTYYFTRPDEIEDDTHPNFRGQQALYPPIKEGLKRC